MSALGEVTPLVRRSGAQPRWRPPRSERLAGAVAIPFLLLAAYGMLRWQTLLPTSMRLRCAGLLGLGVAATLLLGSATRIQRSRWHAPVLVLLAVVAIVAMLPMSGLPWSWTTHARVAVTLRAIGDGIAALPGVTVPYGGTETATRAVIALGGGLLVLGGGMALATAHQDEGAGQRAVAALPLVVLAAIPSALGRPRLVAVHGVALLLLLVLLVFWEPIMRRGIARAVAVVALATAVALPLSARLDSGHAWVSLSRLVSGLGQPAVAKFDWSQTYGPLASAESGPSTVVLRVHARFPAYWKAENLDEFDGTHWRMVARGANPLYPMPGGNGAARKRWDQVLNVTVGAMSGDRVIAAGSAGYPVSVGQPLNMVPGNSPGTWESLRPLRSGDSYRVEAYTPRPSAAQLTTAGLRYPVSIASTELGIQLPPTAPGNAPAEIQFGSYGAGLGIVGGSALTVTGDRGVLEHSPYGPVYRLAQSLEARTNTPYGYVLAVMHHLSQGFIYTKRPPVTANPIAGFLLHTKEGYCQQFAGAMALLLRMGGVPARVAVGFTTGKLSPRSGDYIVTNKDAHAWVEVWFPKYGWVSFDPTPSTDKSSAVGLPVDSPHRPTSLLGTGQASGATGATKPGKTPTTAPATVKQVPGARTASSAVVTAVLAGLVLLLGLWFARLTRRPDRGRRRIDVEPLVAEVERAFARCGRPLRADVTLTALERRVAAGDREAAEYLARLGALRFGTAGRRPTGAQRRALRAWLARGMGPSGRLRALLSLPPRRLN